MKKLGLVGSIIGAIITLFGFIKFKDAKGFYRATSYFGENSSSKIWSGEMDNYKIVLIIGAVILIVGIIVLISGLMQEQNNNTSNTGSNSQNIQGQDDMYKKLSDLKKMKDDGLITNEEFEEKRRKIVDKL